MMPSRPVGTNFITILGYTMSGFSNPGNKSRAINPGIAMIKSVIIVRKPANITPLRP